MAKKNNIMNETETTDKEIREICLAEHEETKSKRGPKGPRLELEQLNNSLFKDVDESEFSQPMRILSMSPMIKPDVFPTGKVLSGIFKGCITVIAGKNQDKSDKAGCLIEIVPSLDTLGYSIPAVATIMRALQITSIGEGHESKFTSPYINHLVQIRKMPEKIPSKQGQDAWHFLVAVSQSPVIPHTPELPL
jgi:hypothetical protein